MKKLTSSFFSLIIVLVLLSSCTSNTSYYEQITSDKQITARINDLNKTIDEIRNQEKGKLINDGNNIIKYVYEIGKSDSYIVTYLFDEKGCYEIGIDAYFEFEKDVANVVEGYKTEISTTEFGKPVEDNNLCRWMNPDQSISIELDFVNQKRGLFIATIFANQ